MNNESLDKALDLVFNAIDKSDINSIDKVELLRNLKTFLENYNSDINILIKEQRKRL